MDNSCTSQYRSRELSLTEQLKVVAALLACRCIKEREQRDTVLSLLNTEFRGILDRIRRRSDNQADVSEIVMACLTYPGSLEKLVEIVISFEGDTTIAAQNLHALMHKLFISPVIDAQLFDKLIDLLIQIQITKQELRSIYHHCVPSGGNSDFSRFQQCNVVQTLSAIARELAGFGLQSNETHPLLTYIRLLSGYASEALKRQLNLWLDQVIQEVYPGAIIHTGDDHSSQSAFFLLVTFQPDCNRQDDKPTRFCVRANLIREENRKRIYEDSYIEEGTHLLADLPVLLDEWIDRCLEKTIGGNLTIELFLPFDLLQSTACDPHQWELKLNYGNKILVSWQYPLVVRSYNRAYESRLRTWDAWKRNWGVCRPDKCCIDTLESYENNGFGEERTKGIKPYILDEEVYHRENSNLHMSLQEVECLLMTFVPPYFDDTPQHIFLKMMDAGTSVALWPRSGDKSPDNSTLERILSGCDLSELPERIRQLRRKDKDNHITLFCDDPNRVPADAKDPFMAPKGSKS